MTRLRLTFLLILSAAVVMVAAPGSALADSAATDIPVCSATGDMMNGMQNAYGLADGSDKGTISFSQPSYTANEDQGQLWITITRSSSAGSEIIYYGVHQSSAQSPWDFQAVNNTEATMVPGQASCQFPVSIVDNGMNGPSIAAVAYLYGSSRAALPANPDNATVTILRNDALDTRDATNPLDLASAPTDGDPLTGANFYVAPDADTGAGVAAQALAKAGDAQNETALRFIADQPIGYRFWFWNTPADPAPNVARYLENAEYSQPGTTVELSTYSVVHPPCGSTANPAFTSKYLNWVRGLAQGIGNFRVVMFFELDSLITTPCLTAAQRHERLADQLKPAIQILEKADPHIVLYLDAGASDAVSAQQTASYLREAGVKYAQGFFVNSTHFQWDTTETAWGQQISKDLGGNVHFLVSSGVNGKGPLLNPHPRTQGVEALCNPLGRGLGTMSTQTGYKNLDGLLWFAPVGNSGGNGAGCPKGSPATAEFWTGYAEMLYKNRVFGFTGPQVKGLVRSGTYVPYSSAFDG